MSVGTHQSLLRFYICVLFISSYIIQTMTAFCQITCNLSITSQPTINSVEAELFTSLYYKPQKTESMYVFNYTVSSSGCMISIGIIIHV